jgi:hypothetical protein
MGRRRNEQETKEVEDFLRRIILPKAAACGNRWSITAVHTARRAVARLLPRASMVWSNRNAHWPLRTRGYGWSTNVSPRGCDRADEAPKTDRPRAATEGILGN